MSNEPREQPLNVEVGKREADAIFRRRDRSALLRQTSDQDSGCQPDEFLEWLLAVQEELD